MPHSWNLSLLLKQTTRRDAQLKIHFSSYFAYASLETNAGLELDPDATHAFSILQPLEHILKIIHRYTRATHTEIHVQPTHITMGLSDDKCSYSDGLEDLLKEYLGDAR